MADRPGSFTHADGFCLSQLVRNPRKPRWLATRGANEECLAALAQLRGLSVDAAELVPEYERVQIEANALVEMKSLSLLETAREYLTVSDLRNRYLLAVAMHTMAQWTGRNSITYYISDIFQYAGVKRLQTSLITSGAYGIVKLFIKMIFAWSLIDKLGRRRCFTVGLALQGATHIYMAIYFGAIDQGNQHASEAAIACMFIYATGWSLGLCTIPYIYCSEIFPTKVRSFGYATTMGLHWFWQFTVVRVTPVMLAAFNKWGAYTFWALICAISLVVLGFWAPETKGVPLERMHELFETSWYKSGAAKLAYRKDSI